MKDKTRKIKRREKKEPRKIKRRRVTVDRLSSSGKCKKCDSLFWFGFESTAKEQIETNPKMARRFGELLDSKLCLTCLTDEKQHIKAYELIQLYIIRGEGSLDFEDKKEKT